MSIKPKPIDRNYRKALPFVLTMAMLFLASCTSNDINNNIRTNMARDVASTMQSATETYDANLETIPKQIRDSTLRIAYYNEEINDYKGTGTGLITDVVTDSTGSTWAIIITAGHVVNNNNQNAILSNQNNEISFESLEQRKELFHPDLSVTAFKLTNSQDKIPNTYNINNLSSFDPNLIIPGLDEVIALGYPTFPGQDNTLRIQQGYQFASRLAYLGFELPFIKVYGTTSGGMSGSPVVDSKGNLIGFLSGFEENFSTLITQNPKKLNVQPLTQEFLDLYNNFVNNLKR